MKRYGSYVGVAYEPSKWPDEEQRNEKAVDAILRSESGETLAIEHTLLQPFEGEKEDTHRFLKAFLRLERDPAFQVQGSNIIVTSPVEALLGRVPKPKKWWEVSADLEEWFLENKELFPIGDSDHAATKYEIPVKLRRRSIPPGPAMVTIGRLYPQKSLHNVVLKALDDKIPKLANTRVDKRLLLLEKGPMREPGEIIPYLVEFLPNYDHLPKGS